ncbi:MAG: glycosyltransferase family 9 protein [Janthinobacterium lividum]
MSGKLQRAFSMPWRDLVRASLRVGGTRSFMTLVALARGLRLLPRAYNPAKDVPSMLVIALTPHLGDAVMLTPMLQALKAAHPHTPIDLAIERSAAALLEPMEELRTIYRLRLGSVPPIGTAASIARVGAVLREYWLHLRGCSPAICIMPRWGDDLFRSFYLAVLTGAPRRVGFTSSVGWPRYPLAPYRDRLLTDAVKGGSGLHEAMRFVYLLQQSGFLTQEDAQSAGLKPNTSILRLAGTASWISLRERFGLSDEREFAVIAPGASHPRRQWPVKHWCNVIRDLASLGIHTVLLSGKSDRTVAEQVHQISDVATTLVAGVTTFAESAALLEHASFFIGSDSGPAHLAGALGTATLVLFTVPLSADADGPSSPMRTRPLGPHVFTLAPERCLPPCVDTCQAAESHCIQQIKPAEVVAVIRAIRQERALS